MTTEYKEALISAGVDLEDALHRFMDNEDLLERMLKKFPADQSFIDLQTALKNENCEDAFRAAHTLKGVSGNLSFKKLFTALCEQVEALRSNDLARAKQLMPSVSEAYEKIMQVIR